MRSLLFTALVLSACATCSKNQPDGEQPPVKKTDVKVDIPAVPNDMPVTGSAGSAKPDIPMKAAPADPVVADGGHDFTEEGKALLIVGACGDGTPPEHVPAKLVDKHCDVIKKLQTSYHDGWVKRASAFFEEHVPKDLPKKVVYPFAGGDLSTALTVYPDADEITTLSLEPAGDPRTLAVLKGAALEEALGKVQYELKFLYRVNFSNTLNMIEAMRGGELPTQLIFGLSAVKLHGYELVKLRYFRIEEDGKLHYLDDDEVKNAPDPIKKAAEQRNMLFANAEVQFRKPGSRIQVWRHIRANLGNTASKGIGPGTKDDPRVIKHLESKGRVAGMTKAASYLLSWDSFSVIRQYLIDHVEWMVSDATGVAPKWGKPAGFEYETYGGFVEPHIEAGNGIAKNWADLWAKQKKRSIKFRFGYYDKKITNHLVIMRKTKT